MWHWECPCGARDIRWYREREEALAAGSEHDCHDCCTEEELRQLARSIR